MKYCHNLNKFFKTNFIVTFATRFGDVSEWSKEHAWKVCILQKGIVSSNLTVSARKKRCNDLHLFLYSCRICYIFPVSTPLEITIRCTSEVPS